MEHTIFNYIDSILFNKIHLGKISETDKAFSVYMLNRWISMYSPEMAELINGCSNYTNSLETKQEQYDYLFNLIPRVRRKRISYIKKNKKEKVATDEELEAYSKILELSKKEITESLDLLETLSN